MFEEAVEKKDASSLFFPFSLFFLVLFLRSFSFFLRDPERKER